MDSPPFLSRPRSTAECASASTDATPAPARLRRQSFGCALVAWVLTLATGLTGLAAEAPAHVLTSVGAVRALPLTEADRKMAVRVQGIVTRSTPYELFIQDGADAIFVWLDTGQSACRMGDYVEVVGTTHSGHLLPVIKSESLRVIERRALPPARPVRYYDLASGREDCQWVEVTGIVRSVDASERSFLTLQLAFDGTALRVVVADPVGLDTAQMVGMRVRVRGVVGGSKTTQRQMIEPVLWVTFGPETFLIEKPGFADLFSAPLHTAKALLEDGGGPHSDEMARIRGVVTCRSSASQLFIRDGTHNLEIHLQQPAALQVGDRIEAVGFPEMNAVQPILQSAFARRLSPGPPPPPVRVSAPQLLDYRYEADLVQVEGELRELFLRANGLVLMVSEGGVVFSVDLDHLPADPERELPQVGSRLSLVGICQIDHLTPPDRFQVVTPASFRLHLRSLDDAQSLTRPPWWTPQRLLSAVAALSAFALIALGWIWSLDRRVRAQTRIILRNAQAAAIQDERNRIAREFHDTLEQQLAGATILLDAIATVVTEQPERARTELNTARAMLRHSLDEAQQAVADLRNDAFFGRDLRTLVEDSVRERLHATSIAVDFRYEGTWPEMDPVAKKHLLRIVQESVTNAIKHASPTHLTVRMSAATDRIELQVIDNGCGFTTSDRPRRGAGKFGLIGLRERAEKIGAQLTIRSAPQHGTTIGVSLPRHGTAPL